MWWIGVVVYHMGVAWKTREMNLIACVSRLRMESMTQIPGAYQKGKIALKIFGSSYQSGAFRISPISHLLSIMRFIVWLYPRCHLSVDNWETKPHIRRPHHFKKKSVHV